MPEPEKDDVAERRDEVLGRMLNTPPKPHKPNEKNGKASRPDKTGDKR